MSPPIAEPQSPAIWMRRFRQIDPVPGVLVQVLVQMLVQVVVEMLVQVPVQVLVHVESPGKSLIQGLVRGLGSFSEASGPWRADVSWIG